MKKELIKSIKILTLALVIGVGTSLVFGEWNEQTTDNPPLGNSPVPINESSSLQTKSGELDVTNGANTGTLSADMLTVFGTSYFGNEVSVGDEDEGTPNVDMHVTGKVGVNLDSFGVGTTPQVELDVAGTGSFRDLSAVAGVTYPAPLCVSTDGSLKVCPEPIGDLNLSLDYGTFNAYCLYEERVWETNVTGGSAPYTYTWIVDYDNTAPGAIASPIVTTTAPYSPGSPKIRNYRHESEGLPTNTNVYVTVTSADGQSATDMFGPIVTTSQSYYKATDGGPNIFACD